MLTCMALTFLQFTFHYASTLSRVKFFTLPADIDLHSTMLLLYPISPPLSVFSTDLHSTMLLLYRDSTKSKWRDYLIYIPLCFYFIPCDSWHNSGNYWFTFHYASTLSCPARIYCLSCVTFTFHYASTLSVCIRTFLHEFVIYIPLCFYFISGYVEFVWRKC